MTSFLAKKDRLKSLFERKEKDILSIYFTAGFPKLDDTMPIVLALQDAGVDLIELGMPYSDPLADGPTIQDSSQQALENGMSIAKLFEQIDNLRDEVHIPIILMGYLNPILQYGMVAFCKKCHKVGIDGLIIPDLPPDIYEKEYQGLFESYGFHNIFLISPQSEDSRIRYIDKLSNGFIYMVSSASITGKENKLSDSQIGYFNRIKAMNLKNKTIIGFGIHDSQSFSEACQYANGAIIGSAFVKLIKQSKDLTRDIKIFTKTLRGLK